MSRSPLRLPSRLGVTVVATLAVGCSPSRPMDAAIDALNDAVSEMVLDEGPSDAAIADVTPTDGGGGDCDRSAGSTQAFVCLAPLGMAVECGTEAVCSPDECRAPCRACRQGPFGSTGFMCLRSRAMPGADCPSGRVCTAAECPAGCSACESPLFCIPDSESDAGVECVTGNACAPEDCNPGCRAVG